TGALAKAKVNVVAMTLVDSQEHGVLRLVADDAAAARRVLSQLNLPMTETEVLCLDLSNRPGALADIATLLGQNHININYAYCTSGAAGGRTTGISQVADARKAQHALKPSSSKHKEAAVQRPSHRR